jgi:glutamine amidotransferase
MIAIIDYGMGNVASVQKALDFLGLKSYITKDRQQIEDADSIILPGVGSFMQGMNNLNERGLVEILNQEVVVNKKKFLGICLGMQLIFENGTEPVPNKGLGWISGTIKKLESNGLRVPHMGWNDLMVLNSTYHEKEEIKDFYFIHSYHAVPDDDTVIASMVNYGFDVVASVQKDNIFATQFHPEKSQIAGLKLMNSFFNNNA